MSPLASHWSASWPVWVAYAALAGAHLLGLTRLRMAGRLEAGQWREVGLFQAGLVLALLALISPVGYWAGIYIWVRAVQDLVLAVVAPGLIVLGAPWTALAAAVSPRRRAASQHAQGDAADAAAAPPRWLRQPLAFVVAFNVIWLGWHLPVLFERALASPAAAAAEHLTYLAAGILFWLQVIGSRPYRPVATPLRRATLLVGTVAADTVLGMVLVFGSGVLYPAYANAAHHVMTVVDDQQLAGAVLWMGMLPPVITAAVAVLLRWLNDEESQALSAGIDRLLNQRNSPWPSRPRFR
jgi:putative membrane protein